jgi:hypothetical protein
LYHYEQIWYAAWLPPNGKEADYIYGYTYAYKDTATVRKVLPRALCMATDDCVNKPSGRSTFITYTQQVTKQDVIDGKDTAQLEYTKVTIRTKVKRMYEPIDRFEAQVQMSIPQWEDSRNIFERIKTTCIADVLTRDFIHTEYWKTCKQIQWLPSVDSVFSFIKSKMYTVHTIYSGNDLLWLQKYLAHIRYTIFP